MFWIDNGVLRYRFHVFSAIHGRKSHPEGIGDVVRSLEISHAAITS